MIAQPLYAITANYVALAEELVDRGGEMDAELQTRWDTAEKNLTDKLKACAFVVRNLTAESLKHEAESKRQANRAAVLNRSVAALKQYVEYNLNVAGLTKVEGVVRLQTNGQSSIVFDGDPERLPDDFRRVIYGLDREAVLEAAKVGLPLPEGVRVERGHHVRILI